MKPIWIVIITVVVMAILGGGGYYYLNGKESKEKNDLQAQIDDLNSKLSTQSSASTGSTATAGATATTATPVVDTTGWKSLVLPLTKGTVKYPATWTLAKEADTTDSANQITYYDLNKGTTNYGSISEYDATEWVKGPGGDYPYQLSATDRAGLLAVVKSLYSAGKLTDALKSSLSKYGNEFMTYSTSDRIYMNYLVSADGKSKGVAMIGTHGQDFGVMVEYTAFLYNPDNNAVVSIERFLTASEVPAQGVIQTDTADKQAHADFINLIATTQRESLSFAKSMDEIDTAVETLKF
jgi:hypothetical protein